MFNATQQFYFIFSVRRCVYRPNAWIAGAWVCYSQRVWVWNCDSFFSVGLIVVVDEQLPEYWTQMTKKERMHEMCKYFSIGHFGCHVRHLLFKCAMCIRVPLRLPISLASDENFTSEASAAKIQLFTQSRIVREAFFVDFSRMKKKSFFFLSFCWKIYLIGMGCGYSISKRMSKHFLNLWLKLESCHQSQLIFNASGMN